MTIVLICSVVLTLACGALTFLAARDARRYRHLRDHAIWTETPAGVDRVWCVIGKGETDLPIPCVESYPCEGSELDEHVDASIRRRQLEDV